MSFNPHDYSNPEEPVHFRDCPFCGAGMILEGWNWEEDEDEDGKFIVWFITCGRCENMVTENA